MIIAVTCRARSSAWSPCSSLPRRLTRRSRPPPATCRRTTRHPIRVGATIFADYTVTTRTEGHRRRRQRFTPNAFNIGRAYLNVTGNISHIVAFRVTPDIVRETGTGSSLNGSYTYRLKYAYAQFNLDDWMSRGSCARFGMQQTPWVDFIDTVYRYRFQGTTLEDREGILSSSDVGATFRYKFAGNYGDVHGGFYNGDNYNRAEANDQKAFMVRGTVRPLPMNADAARPARHRLLRPRRLRQGCRAAARHYRRDLRASLRQRRRRTISSTADQTRAVSPKLDGDGFSVWVTPKTPKGYGWEGLLRFDHLSQEQATTAVEGRTQPHHRRHRVLVSAAGLGLGGSAARLRAGRQPRLRAGPAATSAAGRCTR